MKSQTLSTFVLTFFYFSSFAQKEIGNEEINITKERQVEIQKANRILDKIPPVEKETKEKKMSYAFYDRKPIGVVATKFVPTVISPEAKKNANEDALGFNNYFKIGAGNFGRLYAETFINSHQDRKLVYGIYGFHNGTKRGPVDDKNSASSFSKIKLDGKYHQEKYELKLDLGYERRNYHFYGYDSSVQQYQARDIRQRIHLYNAAVTFENTNPKPKVDYTLTTAINSLTDNYEATELDWRTSFVSYFPIIKDKVTAILNAEAFLTQRTDSYEVDPTRKRNLYRVEPIFKFDNKRFSAKIGFKAVNEYDQIKNINLTKGFPTVSVSYKSPSLIYLFAGFDGDIIRNTLHSFLDENPYLVQQANLLNTYKNQDFYVGSRGDLFSGISYNTKISYGKYQNLYYYNKHDGSAYDSPDKTTFVNTTKYAVEYEDQNTDFVNVSTEIGYSNFSNWKTNLKVDYNYFESVKFSKPLHRPSFVGNLSNTYTVASKLVASVNLYYIAGLYAMDTEIDNEPIKLKNIADLNAEFTYLFSKQLSAFVKLNNIIGQNYQRYYKYPQLGLNFVAGISVAL
jgi:hypothetical protein